MWIPDDIHKIEKQQQVCEIAEQVYKDES